MEQQTNPIDEFKQRVQTIIFSEYQIWADDTVLNDIFDCAVWYAIKTKDYR